MWFPERGVQNYSGEADILSATVGEKFTTTCYLKPLSAQSNFYLLTQCTKGWNR